jgi:uncharacterized membrane protein (DUF485 family)
MGIIMGITVGNIDAFIEAKKRTNNLNFALALLIYFAAVILALASGVDNPNNPFLLIAFLIGGIIVALMIYTKKLQIIVGLDEDVHNLGEEIKNRVTKKQKNNYFWGLLIIFFILLIIFSLFGGFVGGFLFGIVFDGAIMFGLIVQILHNNDIIMELAKE